MAKHNFDTLEVLYTDNEFTFIHGGKEYNGVVNITDDILYSFVDFDADNIDFGKLKNVINNILTVKTENGDLIYGVEIENAGLLIKLFMAIMEDAKPSIDKFARQEKNPVVKGTMPSKTKL